MKAAAALWNVLTVILLLLTLAALACTAAFFVNPEGALSGLAVQPAANVELLPTPDVSLFARDAATQVMPTFPPEWTETFTPSPSPTPTRTPTVTRRPTQTREATVTATGGTPARTPARTATTAPTRTRTPQATVTVPLPAPTQPSGGYPGEMPTAPGAETPPPAYP